MFIGEKLILLLPTLEKASRSSIRVPIRDRAVLNYSADSASLFSELALIVLS
jgi:hypothetical protein